ncbi:MAG: hypothetical protein DRP74_06765 [Candidatus Omnitrophota bacterium]|nr:MAG: hypothetical protein DRP74_06765 [Candidatus Omnitrophota bacterium]
MARSRRRGIRQRPRKYARVYPQCRDGIPGIKCLANAIRADIRRAKNRDELVKLIKRATYLVALASPRRKTKRIGISINGRRMTRSQIIQKANKLKQEVIIDICRAMERRGYRLTKGCRSIIYG